MLAESFWPELMYVTAAGRWAVVGLSFVLGAVLGSFINVVAYRAPRRMSLSHPGSRCSACGHPIRWYDNVPIVGWLRLRGRCRDCSAPFSVRYPLVEAAVGAASALLAWSLALGEMTVPSGEADIAFALQFGPYLFHLLLVCTLICAALAEFDGNRLPLGMLGLVLAAGFALAAVWPDVRQTSIVGNDNIWRGMYAGVTGLLAALALAAVAWPAWVTRARSADVVAGATAAAELSLVGAFLGPRDVALIGATSMACYAVLRVAGRLGLPLARLGWAAALSVVTLLHIVCARSCWDAFPSLARQDDMSMVAAAGAVIAMAALVARFVGSGRPSPAQLKRR